ncbi:MULTISPECIES: MliC family protein [unclassified Neisseria]|uniref:MliC family protein n=1 Tax=unclassified Neisseria TaxID=2623750 RepID=UPI001072626E|nr:MULTISPECIES: MliC family protein [unclassified Neisseria]MBF0804215.1 MliC family protein [Neisseria sp. 19428wB4_WF04]TFU43009.1 hypothetical protein E4T99_07620 [Neisseria sp. WF04]
MKLRTLSLTVAAMLALSACKQEQAQTAEVSTAAPVSEPAPAEAAAAATASAPADIPLGGSLGKAEDAAWQSYQCDGGKTLDARYYRETDEPAAEVRTEGQTLTLPYSGEYSNEDLTAFGNGTYTWTIGNQYQSDLYKEGNGFLVRHEQEKVGGETLPVDTVVVKNCMPAQ